MHKLRMFQHEGRWVAAAVIGAGPPLVLPPRWHLEADLADSRRGAFLRALARSHTVVRHDRPGKSVSDRAAPLAERTLKDEVALLGRVLAELEIEGARTNRAGDDRLVLEHECLLALTQL